MTTTPQQRIEAVLKTTMKAGEKATLSSFLISVKSMRKVTRHPSKLHASRSLAPM
jgi:hypothetical protein